MQMPMKKLVPATMLLLSVVAPAAHAERWNWSVEPYVWGSTITTDVSSPRPLIQGSSEMSFGDILDKLDGSLQVHIEGRGDTMGVYTDFTYLGIAEKKEGRFAQTDADLDMRLLDTGVFFPVGNERDRGLDLMVGARWIDADFKLAIAPNNPQFDRRVLDVGDDYLDLMIGARYTFAPAEKWRVTVRGDGSMGQTDGTWNASLMAHYLTRYGGFGFGYRHLEAEIKQGDVLSEMAFSGPLLGFAFRF